jgi:hypothetical protein
MALTISNIAIVKTRERNLLLLTPDLLLHGGLLTEQLVHGALQLLSVKQTRWIIENNWIIYRHMYSDTRIKAA